MATKEIKARLRHTYLTATEWNSKNPVLLVGEIGVESDTQLCKYGDGKTAWKSLAYGNAVSATKATQDSDGKQINTTYAKLATDNKLIAHYNEFNFVDSVATAYNNAAGVIYFNYRLTDTSSPTNKIKEYRFTDGSGNNLTKISAASFNGYTIASSVPANAKFTDTTYSDATQTVHGLMSISDKKKLDNLSDIEYVTEAEMKAMFTVK